jgi:glutaredoxin
MTTVTLYGRPGCHLCEDARAALERLRAREPFALEDVDIESDPALHARYLERIPVIAVAGEELSELFVDEEALLARLRREGDGGRQRSIVSPR